jgi:Ca2+-binding RTX toxin-like protein
MTARRTTRNLGRISFVGLVALAPLVLTGGLASATPVPNHVGDPAIWGPAVEDLCSNPTRAENLGYNVLELDNFANTFTGSPGPDVIYAYGGNDTINGGAGDDVICLGYGNDKGNGNGGNDAVFGEAAADIARGDVGRDFLDGGGQTDECFGGPANDAGHDCEDETSIP